MATIDGIGTLTMPVVRPGPPDGTGSYLPPVSSYRKPVNFSGIADAACDRAELLYDASNSLERSESGS